jgi:hypothetical protein
MPGPAGAAVPADFALTSIQRVSPAVVGVEEEVEGTYATSGPREANYAVFGFSDRIDGQFNAYGFEGVANGQLNEYEPAGVHKLEFVYLGFGQDDENISLMYWRDGSVDYYTSWDAEPTTGTHSLDFAALDFSVTNPDEDVTVPILNSFGVADRDGLVPGDEVSVDFDATDVGSSLVGVEFHYEAPNGRDRHVSNFDWDGPIESFATETVRKNWISGTYELRDIYLYDDAGLVAVHSRDGSIEKHPSKAEGPATHSLDLSSGDITIDNPDADVVGPELVSISQNADPVYYPGEVAAFSYEASDDKSLIEEASLSWYSTNSYGFAGDPDNYEEDGVLADGQVLLQMDSWMEPGTYELESIWIADDALNYRGFYRDGTTYDDTAEEEGSHSVSFQSGDFELVPWPYTFDSDIGSEAIDIDFETGEFRFTVYFFEDDAEILVATVTPLPGGGFRAVYSADGVTLDGIFEPSTGAFTAKYESGGIMYTLVGGPSVTVPEPPIGFGLTHPRLSL